MERTELIEEYQKCKEDPAYFIKTYVNIVHPIKGVIPFELYRFQQRIVEEIDSHRFSIIKKFRQAGVTTIMCAYSLWLAIFEDNKSILVVSIGDRESKAFLARVTAMYEDLPSFLQPETPEKNKSTIVFSTGSKIKSQPAGAGRGESTSLLIVDEAAFVDNMDEFWAAVYPTISTGGAAVLLSTVNGTSNLYYKLYTEALAGKNNFHPIDIFWREHPEYTDEWAEEIRPNIGERAWIQEYECEFLGTGDTFLNRSTLQQLIECTNNGYYSKYTNMMRVWKDPEPYCNYLLCADASYGTNKDNSAFHIINLYNGEQVAEFYSNKISLKDFAKIINDEGNRYNLAYAVVERNGLGLALIQDLFESFEYENMWEDEKGDLGLLLSAKNRDIILNCMETAVRTSKIRINSERTVNELTSFIITDGGKIQADKGRNDDLVMSLALGAYAAEKIIAQSPIELSKGQNEKKAPEFFGSMAKYDKKGAETIKDYLSWILK
tara:strand:+ start:1260 stop:2735 length:1476 start_codon:yes stop_codon:yes gene_type:complete